MSPINTRSSLTTMFLMLLVVVFGAVGPLSAQVVIEDARPFLGRWQGEVPIPSSPLMLQSEMTMGEKGFVVRSMALRMLITDSIDNASSITNGELIYTISSSSLAAEVRVRPEGAKLVGSFKIVKGPPPAVAAPGYQFSMIRIPDLSNAAEASRYNGTLSIPGGGTLALSMVVAEIDGQPFGEIDIAQQGIKGLVMRISRPDDDPDRYILDLPTPMPAQMELTFADGVFEGNFKQGPYDLPIVFGMGDVEILVEEDLRPQEPTPPFPYEMRELKVKSPLGHQLVGTLVVPESPPPAGAPLVVMVTGSGPQDRDEAIMGHRPFYVLADRLARQGIASFRYDDRGFAESTGIFADATSADFAHDAAAALAEARRQPGIDATRSGLLGHSEGATVSAMVGAGAAPGFETLAPPSFIVLLAGPGVPGHEVLREQMKRLLISEQVEEVMVERISSEQGRLLDACLADADDATMLAQAMALQKVQLEVNGMADQISPEQQATMAQQSVQTLKSPWMARFLRDDPGRYLRSLKNSTSVLAVNGTLDSQVWHEQNLPAIEQSVKQAGSPVRIMRVEGLNHLLQPAATGAVSEYANIKITMDEDTMNQIGSWILEVASPR